MPVALMKQVVAGPAGAPAPGHGDEALVIAIAGGDRGALARLYDRHAAILLAIGQRILGSPRDAEDLLHDVFLEAWRRAGTYDPARGTVRTWLLVRLRARALDRQRAAGAAPVSMEGTDPLEERVAHREDPLLAVDRAAVHRALQTLSSEQRTVLELGYFQGLSSAEIAARTGTPVGTVKSRLALALGRLRARLDVGGAKGGAR